MNIKDLYCSNHSQKIKFLNVKKGVEKELRALCKECEINDAMKLKDVLPLWENHKKILIDELTKQKNQINEFPSKLEKQYQNVKKNLQEAFELTQLMFSELKKQINEEINWQLDHIRSLNDIQHLQDYQDIAEIIADDCDIKNLYHKKFNWIEIYYEQYDFMQHRFNLVIKGLKECALFIQNFQNAISLKTELESIQCLRYLRRGQGLFDSGKYDEAIEYYNQVLQIYPNHDEARRFKGIALQTKGEFQEAIKCFDEAISVNPFNSDTFSNKGNTLIELKLYEEAIICFNEAIRLSSLNSNALNNKGVALHNLNRDTEAVECYDLALSLNQNHKVALNNKYISLQKMNSSQETLRRIEDEIFFVVSRGEGRELADWH